MAFWVQVWKKGRDLRRQNAREPLSWRRSHPKSHTCAKKGGDLRQDCSRPRPEKAVTCARSAADLGRGLALPNPKFA
jgi:hypothetical protein